MLFTYEMFLPKPDILSILEFYWHLLIRRRCESVPLIESALKLDKAPKCHEEDAEEVAAEIAKPKP